MELGDNTKQNLKNVSPVLIDKSDRLVIIKFSKV